LRLLTVLPGIDKIVENFSEWTTQNLGLRNIREISALNNKEHSPMTRIRLCLMSVLLSTAGFLLTLNGCGGSAKNIQLQSQLIQHVVIIFQENRTPDNLFQGLCTANGGVPGCGTSPGQYDIASSGVNSQGQTIPLSPIDLGTEGPNPQNYDLNHYHSSFLQMYDGGKMDGADLIPCTPSCPANAQFMYVKPTDVQPYFQLAEQYTFGDRMFQTNQGPSFPAHQFIISGTSAPSAGSPLFASENLSPGVGNAGCIADANELVKLIDSTGTESAGQYPCFDHPTLTDLLDNKGISWRYYAPSAGSIWTGPDAIKHMCQPQTQSGQLVCTGTTWAKVIIPQTGVLTDIANNELAAVSWVIPSGQASDHAMLNDGSGPSWVASIVNAIGNSSYWSNTVIIIAWDDWGGWYDHVPPTQVLVNCAQWGCGYVYGFRVPLIVVSPYAKAAYISHTPHDFGSILKFIEDTFSLPSLGYADANSLDDLSDCFNFSQTPLTFQTIQAPLGAEHFLNDRTPPTDPDDD
jgi:phospholipase C